MSKRMVFYLIMQGFGAGFALGIAAGMLIWLR